MEMKVSKAVRVQSSQSEGSGLAHNGKQSGRDLSHLSIEQLSQLKMKATAVLEITNTLMQTQEREFEHQAKTKLMEDDLKKVENGAASKQATLARIRAIQAARAAAINSQAQ